MKALRKILTSAFGKRHTAFWMLIFTMATVAFGQSQKISPDLQALPSGNPFNVIVQYYNPPSGNELNAANAAGARNGKALGLLRAYGWTASPGSVQSLVSQDPNIKYVLLDRPLKGAMNFAVPAVNADIAHNLGYDGTGVGIAVIDSGVNPVADLAMPGLRSVSRIVYSQNFDPSANTTSDLYGHGTLPILLPGSRMRTTMTSLLSVPAIWMSRRR